MVDKQKEPADKEALQRLLQKVEHGMTKVQQDALLQQLQAVINDWIVHHFDKLVQLLYTVDVDEKRLKFLLQQQPNEEAAVIISRLLLDRQLQKAEWRKQHAQRKPPADDDEEKW